MVKDSLVNQMSVEDLPKKGSHRYCDLVTKKQGGKLFLRRTMVHGRPYWQTVQYIYEGDKRRLKVIKHHGPRKPRGH